MPLVLARVLDRTRLSATGVWVDGRMDESQIGTIVLWLRIEHVEQRVRARNRAYKSIERHVLTPYGARRLPTGEHTVDFSYRTDNDLDALVDDLLFAISGEAQMMNCYSETVARLEGSDRRW
jgi:hypothetical protein